MSENISISPSGEKFPLPTPGEYKIEFLNLQKRVDEERAKNREIVVVIGVGFVGAVMAAIVADTVDKTGQPSKFVIGMQFWNSHPNKFHIC
jgi:UDP-N-acetyl-D-glucosamine dehydrogenase